jgi:hypothetical protein
MHLVTRFLLIWALFGSLIPAAMVAAPIFISARYSLRQRITILILAGPPIWAVLSAGGISALVMALVHKMRPGRPLVPPAPPRG